MTMPILPGLGGGAPKAKGKAEAEEKDTEGAEDFDMTACDEMLADVQALNEDIQASEASDDEKKKMADFADQAEALHGEIADAEKADTPEDAVPKIDELTALVDEAKEFAQGLGVGEEDDSPESKKDPSQRELQPSTSGDRLLEWAKS